MSTASRPDVAVRRRAADPRPRAFVLRISQLGAGDEARVGEEASSLGAIFGALSRRGVRVPNGFATTVHAYAAHLDAEVPGPAWRALSTQLDRLGVAVERSGTLRRALGALLGARVSAEALDLPDRCAAARALCLATPVPVPVTRAIGDAYDALCAEAGEPLHVTVRSSATGEDSEDAWLAGRHDSFLAVHGGDAVTSAWRRCAAGALTERAVSDRMRRGKDPRGGAVPVVVMAMVRSDLAGSGLILTHDPDSGNDGFIQVSSSYGLGDPVVRGSVSSDTFLLWKEGLRRATPAIVGRVRGSKQLRLVRTDDGTATKVVTVDESQREAWSLCDDDVVTLARAALVVEEHYGRPMEIEWAEDGVSGELHLVRARPVQAPWPRAEPHAPAPCSTAPVPVRESTAVKLDIGAPERATKDAMLPTDGVGLVRLELLLASRVGVHPLALAHYDELRAFADVGEVRPALSALESRLLASGRDRVRALVEAVDLRTRGYAAKRDFFVERLRESVARVCAAFHPRPVLVRLSDMKSNEYRDLVGGGVFEPEEENPMIAWRGAARLIDPRFRPAFDMECEALSYVRWDMGLDNLQISVPFCRTPEEGGRVVELLARHRLAPDHGVPLFLMVELPANVVEADRFIDEMSLSGGSIGTDDLVQTVYALSREDLAHYGAELDVRAPSVRRLVVEGVRRFARRGLEVGICGHARSGHSDEVAAFLVECGVTSVSVAPDAFFEVRAAVTEAESAHRRPPARSA